MAQVRPPQARGDHRGGPRERAAGLPGSLLGRKSRQDGREARARVDVAAAFARRRADGAGRHALVRSTSSPRAPPRSGASACPPSPETGVALAALPRRDGSRGRGALRFGARYGSSDSLPRACLPAPPARESVSVESVADRAGLRAADADEGCRPPLPPAFARGGHGVASRSLAMTSRRWYTDSNRLGSRPHSMERRGLMDSRSSYQRDGIIAGLIAAAIVAVWFLIYDAARGYPFRTPALLGAAAIQGVRDPGTVAVSPSLVAQYTVLHGVVFAMVGILIAFLIVSAQSQPSRLLVVFIALLCFEVAFLAVLTWWAHPVVTTVRWWAILIGNALAAVGMLAYFFVGYRPLGRHLMGPWVRIARE